jgi:Fe-S-cluster containining protein
MNGVDPSIYKNGLNFECQGCGRCCQSRGEYSYVYVSLPERQHLARHLRLSTLAFTKRYCVKTDGLFHLRDPEKGCLFSTGNRCSVYLARPVQCSTWPVWPENMNKKVWFGEVLKDCPGIGTGPLLSAKQIEKRLRKAAEVKYKR